MGLRVARGDIWSFHTLRWIVIPTNAGWRRDGENVMGRGLARDAALRWPELPAWYGQVLQEDPDRAGVARYAPGHLLTFPTKPRQVLPWTSWRYPATIEQITMSCDELGRSLDSEWPDIDAIALPLVGCGNGGLEPAVVRPVLEEFFGRDPRFVLVIR